MDAHSLPSAGEMATEGEDVKVKPEGASSVINIVVKDQNSGEVHFKVGLSTDLLRAFSHPRAPHHSLLRCIDCIVTLEITCIMACARGKVI